MPLVCSFQDTWVVYNIGHTPKSLLSPEAFGSLFGRFRVFKLPEGLRVSGFKISTETIKGLSPKALSP